MFKKFAVAAILDAQMGADAGFSKSAHRAVFNYTPRNGYLYVRSRAISSRCNDNFDMFPAEDIESAYRTFLGKPVFVNHHNDDHRRARGVIIDAALHKDLNPDGSPDTWVELLHEVDAVKFPKLAKAILKKEVNRTSMGCDVQFSKCSVCHNVASSPLEYCAHIPGKKGKRIYRVDPATGKKEGTLVFEVCSGLSFFENSLLVEQPADPTAFFLGDVESGGGLDHLKASIQTTASVRPAPQRNPLPMQRTASRQQPTSKVWSLLQQAAQEDATPRFAEQRVANHNMTSSIWSLIEDAVRTGDDSLESHTAMGTNDAEDYVRNATKGGKGVKNILSLVHQAQPHEIKSGMNWYGDAHKMAKSITNHYQAQEGHMLSKDTHADALHKVAGAIGVYSEGTAPAPNFHYASEAVHHEKPIYSHPQFVKGEDGKEVKHPETGKKIPLLDDKGQQVNHGFLPESNYRGMPGASSAQASKVRSFFSGKKIDDVMKTAHKTRNYSSLIENPNSTTDEGKDRVVVDRHAIAAVMGHQGSSGEVYNGKGSTFLSRPTGKGKFKDGNYEHVADMYRQAAHHINSSDEFEPLRKHLRDTGTLKDGERVRGHHVQAISWIKQKQISDSHNRQNKGPDQDVDNFQQHYTNRYGSEAHKPDSWQGFAGGDGRHGSRRPFGKSAYGETKAPQDVDTLRAENCTVCGNSTAFDGKQCQVCGYVAPPKAFGDPDTDVARANDMRKQVMDGDEADPMDTDQQMGNQIGNPDEVQDQDAEAASGEDSQLPMLNCNNCGTGVQPAAPASAGGEPPYPADGDACPVCKKGQLLSGADEEEGGAGPAEGDDEDVDGGGSEGNGQAVPGDESGDEEPEEGDDDSDEEDDAPPPSKKKKGKDDDK